MLRAVEVQLTEPICACPQETRSYGVSIGNTDNNKQRRVGISCARCGTETSSYIKGYALRVDREFGTTRAQLEAEVVQIKERVDALNARWVECDHALARLVSAEAKKEPT